MKKSIMFSALIAIILASVARAASAAEHIEYIRLQVVGQNVNLREAPNMKGRVAFKVSEEDFYIFIAEAVPAADRGGKPEWYKIIFTVGESDDSFGKPYFDGKAYNALYLSAKFARQAPLTDFDEAQIEYYKKGRPPRYNTGDTVGMSGFSPEEISAFPIKQAVSLYLAPQKNTRRQSVPAGAKLLQYSGEGGFCFPDYMNAYGVFYFHLDMDDIVWTPFIDENRRIIGWLPEDEADRLKF
jgi:hypothetical protein